VDSVINSYAMDVLNKMGVRYPVQICTLPESENYHPTVVALANDGTLWELSEPGKRSSKWEALPALPSREECAGFPPVKEGSAT
jgi:hypothetical protein